MNGIVAGVRPVRTAQPAVARRGPGQSGGLPGSGAVGVWGSGQCLPHSLPEGRTPCRQVANRADPDHDLSRPHARTGRRFPGGAPRAAPALVPGHLSLQPAGVLLSGGHSATLLLEQDQRAGHRPGFRRGRGDPRHGPPGFAGLVELDGRPGSGAPQSTLLRLSNQVGQPGDRFEHRDWHGLAPDLRGNAESRARQRALCHRRPVRHAGHPALPAHPGAAGFGQKTIPEDQHARLPPIHGESVSSIRLPPADRGDGALGVQREPRAPFLAGLSAR